MTADQVREQEAEVVEVSEPWMSELEWDVTVALTILIDLAVLLLLF